LKLGRFRASGSVTSSEIDGLIARDLVGSRTLVVSVENRATRVVFDRAL
jgi:hypothetical protein